MTAQALLEVVEDSEVGVHQEDEEGGIEEAAEEGLATEEVLAAEVGVEVTQSYDTR